MEEAAATQTVPVASVVQSPARLTRSSKRGSFDPAMELGDNDKPERWWQRTKSLLSQLRCPKLCSPLSASGMARASPGAHFVSAASPGDATFGLMEQRNTKERQEHQTHRDAEEHACP